MISKIRKKLERIKTQLQHLEKVNYKFRKHQIKKMLVELIANIELLGKDFGVSHSIDKAKDFIEDRWVNKKLASYGIKKVRKIGIKELYQIWSKWYEKEKNPLIQLEKKNLSKFLRNVKNKSILDLGCGAGRHSVYLAKKGALVHAIDLSKEMLHEAKRKARKKKLRINFKQYDITKRLPYKNEMFDIVLCALVLNHIKDFKVIFKEIARILKKGGVFLLSDIHPSVPANAYEKYPLIWSLGLTTIRYKHTFSDYFRSAKFSGLNMKNCIEAPKGTKKQTLLLILRMVKK